MPPTISRVPSAFHFEAEKNRFGIFSDLNFARLSTESDFTLQGPLAVTVNGDADMSNTFFEAGASYRLSDTTNVAVHRRAAHLHAVEPNRIQHTECLGDADRCQPHGGQCLRRRHLSAETARKSQPDQPRGHRRRQRDVLVRHARIRVPAETVGRSGGRVKAVGVEFGKEEDDKEIRKVDLTYYGPIFGSEPSLGAASSARAGHNDWRVRAQGGSISSTTRSLASSRPGTPMIQWNLLVLRRRIGWRRRQSRLTERVRWTTSGRASWTTWQLG